jgi:predicted nucleic acid-binding protein
MAAQSHPKRLALDTNVLMDLADGNAATHAFLERFQTRGYDLRVPPTVLVELAHFSKHGSGEKQRLSTVALKSLQDWKITPFVLSEMERKSILNFIQMVQDRELLPTTEVHDVDIIAETALADIPALVTSDTALLEADPDGLSVAFADGGLPVVRLVHPARMARALR